MDEFQIPHLQVISHYCPELLTTRYFSSAAGRTIPLRFLISRELQVRLGDWLFVLIGAGLMVGSILILRAF